MIGSERYFHWSVAIFNRCREAQKSMKKHFGLILDMNTKASKNAIDFRLYYVDFCNA